MFVLLTDTSHTPGGSSEEKIQSASDGWTQQLKIFLEELEGLHFIIIIIIIIHSFIHGAAIGTRPVRRRQRVSLAREIRNLPQRQTGPIIIIMIIIIIIISSSSTIIMSSSSSSIVIRIMLIICDYYY